MPFEIFLVPGLLLFAYGFFKAKKYYEHELEEKEDDE